MPTVPVSYLVPGTTLDRVLSSCVGVDQTIYFSSGGYPDYDKNVLVIFLPVFYDILDSVLRTLTLFTDYNDEWDEPAPPKP